jgi:hypothetical protein
VSADEGAAISRASDPQGNVFDDQVSAADELFELLTATDTFDSFLQELAVLAAREGGWRPVLRDHRPIRSASADRGQQRRAGRSAR